jgi:hypothetical protein
MRLIIFFYFILLSQLAFAELSEDGFFSGRLSRINYKISAARIKVDFDNIKYLNVKDKIQFWDIKNKNQQCTGYVLGRSANYVLVKIPQISYCEKFLYFTTGAYFKFFSEDLSNSIKMGKDVVGILIKKRLAVQGQIEAKNKELMAHVERGNALNARYQVLREKLDTEWKKELQALETDKLASKFALQDLSRRRDEIDQKMELYKVRDENLITDRWSLDSKLYYKK